MVIEVFSENAQLDHYSDDEIHLPFLPREKSLRKWCCRSRSALRLSRKSSEVTPTRYQVAFQF